MTLVATSAQEPDPIPSYQSTGLYHRPKEVPVNIAPPASPSIKVVVQDEQEMAIAQTMKFALLPQVGDLIWVRGAKYVCVDTKREFFDPECRYLAIVRPA